MRVQLFKDIKLSETIFESAPWCLALARYQPFVRVPEHFHPDKPPLIFPRWLKRKRHLSVTILGRCKPSQSFTPISREDKASGLLSICLYAKNLGVSGRVPGISWLNTHHSHPGIGNTY